jgi:hypothetical protein
MSKIKFSALVSDVRNKLNGSVLSKNRYGNYIRNKTTPVNPQTTAQQNARAALAANSQAWAGLTEAQRLSWKALAAELPFTDIFGDSKILAANSLYVKLNGNLQKIGATAVSDAPAKVAVPSLEITTFGAIASMGVMDQLTAEISPATVQTGFEIAVYATPGIAPGRNFVKNQFRYLGIAPAPVAGTLGLEDLWNARFGSILEGQKVFIRLAFVSEDSGQQGIPVEAVSIVTGP